MEQQQIEQKKPKSKSWIGGIIFVVIVVIIVIGAVSGRNGDETRTTSGVDTGVVKEDSRVGPNGEKIGNRVGDLAPDFVTADSEGNEVRLTDFAGTPVLINFWATWCPFCVDELPLFLQVQEELGEQFVTLAVNRAESVSRAQSYTDDLGVTQGLNFVYDHSDRIYDRYGGFSMPVSIFVDSDGVIQSIKQGPLLEQELKSRLDTIIP